MNQRQWMKASRALHRLLLDTARTEAPTIAGVVELHAPRRQADRGLPVCYGDDKATTDLPDAEWPCRTVTRLVRDLLDIRDVEDYLAAEAGSAHRHR